MTRRLVMGAAASALLACGGGAPSAPAPAPAGPLVPSETGPLVRSEAAPNVVLITLDTLRADRVGAYGYARASTDTIDQLANSGARYTNAYSPVPFTIPSHAAILTGRYPAHLGIRGNGAGQLADAETTLAELLSARGYKTAASVAAFVTTRVWGFRQGFDAYFDTIPSNENFWHGERPANLVVDDALGWVSAEAGDVPLFLWVHLYDAHFPYVAPEPYLAASENRPYDAEIAFLDDQIGRVVEAFAGQPTVFVLVGDHGEGLGEHVELNHGMFVYQPTQHVPFIVSGAGIQPTVASAPTSLVDVVPIVLKRLGMAQPEGLDGVADRPADSVVYMESWDLAQRFGLAPHVGVVSGALKLIDTPRPELYDLVADPLEALNLAEARPADVARLQAQLKDFGFAPPSQAAESMVDPAVAAQLAQLGYVDGDMVPGAGPAPDPKDRIELLRQSQQADRLLQMQKSADAIALLRELVAKNPAIMEFRNRLAGALGKLGRHAEARAVLEEGLRINPDSPSLRMAHAGSLAEQGKLVEASAAYEKLATDEPYMPRVRGLAVQTLHQAGQTARALELAQAWLKAWPADRSLQGVLGAMLAQQGRMDDAIPLLEAANQDDRPEYDVAFLLAGRALTAGDAEASFALFGKEIASYPQNLRAIYARARLALKLHRWPELVEAASMGVELRADDSELWYLLVMGRFNLGDYARARVAVDKGLAVDPGQADLLLMDANLLAKEGKMDAAKARFEVAQAAKAARDAAGAGADPHPGASLRPSGPAPSAALRGAPGAAPVTAPAPAADQGLGLPVDPEWAPR